MRTVKVIPEPGPFDPHRPDGGLVSLSLESSLLYLTPCPRGGMRGWSRLAGRRIGPGRTAKDLTAPAAHMLLTARSSP
jgi:hypothetical protein